jgi:protein SCO1
MRARLILATLLGLAASAFTLHRAAASNASGEAGTLPFYATRDFTPHWTPVDHRVPSFALTDQTGALVTNRDLEGKIHIASFFFTSCGAVCPTLVERLKPAQESIRGRGDAIMVSFSVTPRTDTPTVLAKFGKQRGIDPSAWRLLTGEPEEILRVMRDFYFADDDRDASGVPRLTHTERVLLVDQYGRLRGVYNGTSAFEIERLVADVETLRSEQLAFGDGAFTIRLNT